MLPVRYTPSRLSTLSTRSLSPLQSLWNFYPSGGWLGSSAPPALLGDWDYQEKEFSFSLEVPGIPKEDIHVSINEDKHMLVINAADKKMVSYSIPSSYSEVTAKVENGLLTVVFLRSEENTTEIPVL